MVGFLENADSGAILMRRRHRRTQHKKERKDIKRKDTFRQIEGTAGVVKGGHIRCGGFHGT